MYYKLEYNIITFKLNLMIVEFQKANFSKSSNIKKLLKN